jgi:hypothetical protein
MIAVKYLKNMPGYLLLFVLIFPFAVNAQKLGQGILKINISNLPSVLLYADTNQLEAVKKIELAKEANGETIIRNREEVGSWFKPEQLFLEYDIFMIRVEAVSGKWLLLYTDNEKGTTMWTKAGAGFTFIPWQKFLLKEISSIEKHPAFNLDIKASSSDNARTIKKIETTDCFEVLEINGAWMHIRTNLRGECNESKMIIKSGWIKWKQDNKLTINYSLMA